MQKIVALLIVVGLAAPALVQAEVYKWKDKNGVTRYSDVPPSDMPHQPLKPKKAKAANVKTVQSSQDGAESAAAPSAQPAKNDAIAKGKPASQEEAANKRQLEAERAKKEAEVKAAEQKQNDDNCATAKSNLSTFSTGGRIVRMNENGEREFVDDAGIAKGLADAKADVDKYCK